MRPAIHQAITAIRSRYAEPISLTQLAAEVFVSPFHFSRAFAKEIGVTPGRYLTAVRLFEAKRLLLTTSRTVADIVCEVGYSSVGTFTSRFTTAVGMTPTQYRAPEVAKLLLAAAPDFCFLPSLDDLRDAGLHLALASASGTVAVSGKVSVPQGKQWDVLIGLYADAVPQSGPVAFQYVSADGAAAFTIPAVPPGRWHVIAMARSEDSPCVLIDAPRTALTVDAAAEIDLDLRPRELGPTDVPIAVTLARRDSRGLIGAQRRAA